MNAWNHKLFRDHSTEFGVSFESHILPLVGGSFPHLVSGYVRFWPGETRQAKGSRGLTVGGFSRTSGLVFMRGRFWYREL